MSEKLHCPACGARLPAGREPGEPCPSCLMRLGLDPEAEGSDPPFEPIGPYRLQEVLGEGGMGIVYLAEQSEPIRRRVALKVLKPGMDSQEVLARFETERQALALMDHPHIARVLEAGATEAGRPYFVMEYVPGVPITDYCDRHRLSMRERLELFTDVCHAVQHAHQKGIIHRDLKPSNVLVAVREGAAEPKIIDFGVARATAQRLTERTLHTQLGQQIGTPEYMSPEQAETTRLDVDTRSDVYSLGVLLYELLVGALPFDARDLRAAGLEAILRTIREDEPPKPSTRVSTLGAESETAAHNRRTDRETLARRLRGDLDWIVMKALEKDRTRRYPTAHELAADVDRFLVDAPVLAGPPSAVYRARKFVRRHRTGVAAAGAAVLALVLGVAGTTAAWLRASRAEARAVAAEAQAVKDAETAERVSAFLTGLFEAADPAESKGERTTARELLDEGAAQIGRELAAEPEIRAEIETTIGAIYRRLGIHDRAEELLERAVTTRRELLGAGDLALIDSQVELALEYLATDRLDEALPILRQAIAVREEALGREHPKVADALYYLASALPHGGASPEAEELMRRAVAIQEKAHGADHPEVATALMGLASFYWKVGRYDEAQGLYERVVAIREPALGADHPDLAEGLHSLGVVHHVLGRHEEAERIYGRALAIQEQALDPDHPTLATTLNSLAALYRAQERYAEAQALLERVLEASERRFGPDSNRVAIAAGNLGNLLFHTGDADAALPHLQRSLDIMESHWPEEHPNVAWAISSVARVLAERGEFAASERLFRRALAIWEVVAGAEHRRTASELLGLAGLYQLQGRTRDAQPLYRRSVAIYRQALGSEHPDTVAAVEAWAAALRAEGREEEAERLLASTDPDDRVAPGP